MPNQLQVPCPLLGIPEELGGFATEEFRSPEVKQELGSRQGTLNHSISPEPLTPSTLFRSPIPDTFGSSLSVHIPALSRCHTHQGALRAPCVKRHAQSWRRLEVASPLFVSLSLSAHSPAYGHFALRICVISRIFCGCVCVCVCV